MLDWLGSFRFLALLIHFKFVWMACKFCQALKPEDSVTPAYISHISCEYLLFDSLFYLLLDDG